MNKQKRFKSRIAAHTTEHADSKTSFIKREEDASSIEFKMEPAAALTDIKMEQPETMDVVPVNVLRCKVCEEPFDVVEDLMKHLKVRHLGLETE